VNDPVARGGSGNPLRRTATSSAQSPAGVFESIGEATGLVFEIQRFSVQDGPGIRTTVFLKGCRLDCLWCSNPESKPSHPALIVREVKCRRCGSCLEACPEGAIALCEDEGRKIDWARCSQCLLCVDACKYGSLNTCGRTMQVAEVVDEVIADRVFYETSNGGVTFSGGEPLWQVSFLRSLLMACKGERLHTALDTSGCAPWQDIEGLLRFVDLVLYDVKHLDPLEHRRMTGAGNELILENLRRVAKRNATWLRVPLIAGFNDSEQHISGVVGLAKEIGAERVSLLPYHEGGRSKSAQVGEAYGSSEGQTPTDEHIAELKKIAEREGMEMSVGS
jgi:pyruvate formate lyase activating enzyme